MQNIKMLLKSIQLGPGDFAFHRGNYRHILMGKGGINWQIMTWGKTVMNSFYLLGVKKFRQRLGQEMMQTTE